LSVFLDEASRESGFRDIFRDIACEASQPTLSYRHYPHLGEILKPLRHYLRTALRSKIRGINLFLHGPPGTGKSELSRVLARDLQIHFDFLRESQLTSLLQKHLVQL